jgi:hypothetical protein
LLPRTGRIVVSVQVRLARIRHRVITPENGARVTTDGDAVGGVRIMNWQLVQPVVGEPVPNGWGSPSRTEA